MIRIKGVTGDTGKYGYRASSHLLRDLVARHKLVPFTLRQPGPRLPLPRRLGALHREQRAQSQRLMGKRGSGAGGSAWGLRGWQRKTVAASLACRSAPGRAEVRARAESIPGKRGHQRGGCKLGEGAHRGPADRPADEPSAVQARLGVLGVHVDAERARAARGSQTRAPAGKREGRAEERGCCGEEDGDAGERGGGVHRNKVACELQGRRGA